ncbi:MAG: LAGLIDADG family homing endonuclease [Candidatus Yanofskybacteria bacterium]|nr:LAGLIDADG family homing endonuclease [Candidatus Yanofskybacteria bacterium]
MTDATHSTPLSPDFVAGLTTGEGCFDLQFRRDVRRERNGSPIYYGWKAQYVVSLHVKDLELIKKLVEVFQCGTVHTPLSGDARFSIQDIENLFHVVVPFFREYRLYGNKQKDFELWAEAIEILYQNKTQKTHRGSRGFVRKVWQKEPFRRLLELHKLMVSYKSTRPQGYKWIKEAERFVETLED